MNKTRVKCANCGMIYDLVINDEPKEYPDEPNDRCPGCGSNAYDKLQTEKIKKQE